MDTLHQSYNDRIFGIMQKHQTETAEMRDMYSKEIDTLRLRIRDIEEQYSAQISTLRKEMSDKSHELENLTDAYNTLNEQKILCDARIHAYMYQNQEFTEDHVFTDKESFKALEKEYEMFNKFFGDEWKKTKKQIRKELLSMSNLTEKEAKPDKEAKTKKKTKNDKPPVEAEGNGASEE